MGSSIGRRRVAGLCLAGCIAFAGAGAAWAAHPGLPASRSTLETVFPASDRLALPVSLDATPRSGREAAGLVAAAAGLRIENPQALDGLPAAPRLQDGMSAQSALSMIGREARLRAVYSGDTVRYVAGDHHFAPIRGSGEGALVDVFVLGMPVQGVLEGLAGATGYGLLVDPALEASKPVTLDLRAVPLKTVLTILAGELGADIALASGRIVARPAPGAFPPP